MSSQTDDQVISRLLPPLSFYLHGGAVACGEPTYDPDFQTCDFFILLDIEALTKGREQALPCSRPRLVRECKGVYERMKPALFGERQIDGALFPASLLAVISPPGQQVGLQKSGPKLPHVKAEGRGKSTRRNNCVNPECA
jgi:hypothetical protein